MRYLSEQELELIYSIVEKAVETKSPVDIPKYFSAELSFVIGNNGFYFVIPGVYWIDGENRYEALLGTDVKDNDLKTLRLYVKGYRKNDMQIGDEVWMFKVTYRRTNCSSVLTLL